MKIYHQPTWGIQRPKKSCSPRS